MRAKPLVASRWLLLSALLAPLSGCMQELSVGISPLASEPGRDAGRPSDDDDDDDGRTRDAATARDAEADVARLDAGKRDSGALVDAAHAYDAGSVDGGSCADEPSDCEPDAGEPPAPPGRCEETECPVIVFLTPGCPDGRQHQCWREELGGQCDWACPPPIVFTGPVDESDAGKDAGR